MVFDILSFVFDVFGYQSKIAFFGTHWPLLFLCFLS